MTLRLPLVLACALSACAHASSQAGQRELVIRAGDAAILLRYARADDEAARQVRRVLPGALSVAERWGAVSSPVVITIQPTHEALEAAAHRPGNTWLRAWARTRAIELQSPRTWSHGDATDEEMSQLLAHELTHCAMFQAIGGDARVARGIPAWFREGMATTNAGERFAVADARPAGEPLSASVLREGSGPPLVYATADRAFRYLAQRYGRQRIHLLLARVRDGTEFPEAFRGTMGVSLAVFEDDFRSHVGQERIRG